MESICWGNGCSLPGTVSLFIRIYRVSVDTATNRRPYERKRNMSESLLIGYAKKCITPKESVPLAGYGNSAARMSQSVINDLYATCTIYSDGKNTPVVLFSIDLLLIQTRIFDPIRQKVAELCGVPMDYVLISATHTHSGPDVGCQHEAIDRYLPFMEEQILAAAKEAMADLKPATISIASGKTKKLSSVRHYVLEDGSYKGANLNVYHTSPIAYHSSAPDPHMQLVVFSRTGGKDVVVANWQTHAHLTGFQKADLSADIIGVMRDEMEKAIDCDFVYFSGASGNLTIRGFDKRDGVITDYLEHGKRLAQVALEAMKELRPVAAGPVLLTAYTEQAPIKPEDPKLLETARDVWDFFTTSKDYTQSILYSESKGLHSQYQANYILLRQQMYDEGTRFREVPVFAFRVGDVGFVAASYEMFDTNGKYIRDFSPFAATVVATCANAYNSYIPSAYGCLNDCYEADVSLVPPGTGERLAQKLVKMLESLND